MNWTKIMKTITDDPDGFFEQGGWSFLDPDSDAEGDDMDDEDEEDDQYNPTDEEVGEEESESDFSGESDVTESDADLSGKFDVIKCKTVVLIRYLQMKSWRQAKKVVRIGLSWKKRQGKRIKKILPSLLVSFTNVQLGTSTKTFVFR